MDLAVWKILSEKGAPALEGYKESENKKYLSLRL